MCKKVAKKHKKIKLNNTKNANDKPFKQME